MASRRRPFKCGCVFVMCVCGVYWCVYACMCIALGNRFLIRIKQRRASKFGCFVVAATTKPTKIGFSLLLLLVVVFSSCTDAVCLFFRSDYLKQLGANHVVLAENPLDLSRNAFFKQNPSLDLPFRLCVCAQITNFNLFLFSVDVVLECVGEPYLNASLRTLRAGGRLVLIGNVTNGRASFGIGLPILNELVSKGGGRLG